MPRRILEGDVVSDKTDKTITVLVERRFMHPLYKKYVKKTSKYAAHDANNQFKTGDRVSIIECAPISKRKRWTVVTGDEAAAPAPKKEEKKPAAKKAAPKKDAKKEEAKKPASKKPAAKKAAPKKDEAKAKKAPAKKPAAKKTTAKKDKKES